MINDYTELEIRIRLSDRESVLYELEAEVNDGSHYGPWEYRMTPEMERTLRMAEVNPREFGLRLFYDLGAGPIRRAYDRAVGRADAQTGGRLRLRLNLDNESVVLNAMPWEMLYHIHREVEAPLAAVEATPFSRYTELEIPEPPPVTQRPLKMLVVMANPTGLDSYRLQPIPIREEIVSLLETLRDLQRTSQVQVKLLSGCTPLDGELQTQIGSAGWEVVPGPASLTNLIRHGDGCHILHLLSHGVYNRQRQQAVLLLEAEQPAENGKIEAEGVLDQELVEKLAAAGMPQLIFLAACESASRTFDPQEPHYNAFVGLGPRLVQAGAPAVVAMQNKVAMDLARTLAAEFYRKLFQHGIVDLALNQARLLVLDRDDFGWSVPVLFTRLKGNRLFAGDPVRAILQGMHRRGYQYYPPFPVEVCHLVGHQDLGNLDHLPEDSLPTRRLLETVETIFQDQIDETAAAQNEGGEGRARVILLLGWRGSGRTSQLWNIARYTACLTLEKKRADALSVIPVFVDFREFSRSAAGPRERLKRMVLESMRREWPQMEEEILEQWLRGEDGVILRLLLDDSSELPAQERRLLWYSMRSLARQYPRVQIMVTLDRQSFDMQLLRQDTDLLIIQPLSESKVCRFLSQPDAPAHFGRLLQALKDRQLFDLAASPWLLHTLMRQAEQNILPQSRTDVLANFMNDALETVAPRRSGMRIWAEETLYRLAWRIQSSRRLTWKEQDVFETMAQVRRYREYQLDDLYEKLLQSGLIAREGEEDVRFSYRGIQAYCCAQAINRMPVAEQETIIDDITASLGRLTRFRWWEITLILLSRLMDDPNRLIRAVDFGIDLTEGEQVFLMARILLENPEGRISPELANQIVSTLIWRTDARQEPRPQRRARAAQLLGQLLISVQELFREFAGVPALVQAAFGRVRPLLTGEEGRDSVTYDFSSVRMQAAMALRDLAPSSRQHIQEALEHLNDSQEAVQFFTILAQWQAEEVESLQRYIGESGHGYADHRHAGIGAVAAFALGDIAATTPGDAASNDAQMTLIQAFWSPEIQGEMRWAVTDALTLLDYADVRRQIIEPVLDQNESAWRDAVAYLIGITRTQDQRALDFLQACLKDETSPDLKMLAIDAMARIYDDSCVAEIAELARGNFDQLNLDLDLDEETAQRLRRHAIMALGNLGDREIVQELQTLRKEWTIELERALFLASEEIDWRLEFSPQR